VSENRKRAAQSQLVISRVNIARAQAQVAQAKAADRRRRSGLCDDSRADSLTVLNRDVEIGSPVSSILNLGANATLVMTLGDIEKSSCEARWTRRTSDAWLGPPRIRVETFKDRVFGGHVTQISPLGSRRTTSRAEVGVSIDNLAGSLGPI
jgi:HlyD family secretion protein